MKNLLILFLSALLLQNALGPAVLAQSGVATKIIQPSQSSALLSNQDVVDMQRANVTTTGLIAKIRSSNCEFDLSAAGLEALKSAAIPAAVIVAMFQAMQPSAKEETAASQSAQKQEIVIPAGTPLEIESAAKLDSFQVRPGDLLSFRVLVPLKIDGVTVIDHEALVTARVLEARRGGHWGRAGLLSWTLLDVVAVDGSRVPVSAADLTKATKQSLAKTPDSGAGQTREDTNGSVKGDSHSGEIAARTAVMGALLIPAIAVAPFLAPLILMHGFKRGENAVLPAHKRFVVFISSETNVKVVSER